MSVKTASSIPVENVPWIKPNPTVDSEFDPYLLTNAPPTLRYFSDFITEEQEKQLISEIESVPKSLWVNGTEQSKLNYGRAYDDDGEFVVDGGVLPDWANKMLDDIMKVQRGFSDISRPEFFRVNKYQPGGGIRPHLDFQKKGPLNSIVSLGGTCLLDFYSLPPKDVKYTEKDLQDKYYVGSAFMEPRSLLFLSDDIFTKYLHGIKLVDEDVITEKVFNRPDYLAIGDVVQRILRYSMTSRYNGKHDCIR